MAIDPIQSNLAALLSTATKSKARAGDTLGMTQFLQLIAAQLTHQDPMNPVDNTQFLAQMAQFSTLQMMNELIAMSTTQYAIGLIGKEATVARLQSDGSLLVRVGTITGVGLYDNQPVVYIEDEIYSMSEIMIIGKAPIVEKNGGEENPPGDEEGGDIPPAGPIDGDDGGETPPADTGAGTDEI